MPGLTIPHDHRETLQAAAARLAREFDGAFGTETIERLFTSSYLPTDRRLPGEVGDAGSWTASSPREPVRSVATNIYT